MSEVVTEMSRRYVLCHICGLLQRMPGNGGDEHKHSHCTRCGSEVFYRKFRSVKRTWGFLLAAMVAIVPANLYPVMTISYLGDSKPSTIIAGIRELAESGMIPIAVLVFVASIAVPFLKIFGLLVLLLVVKLKWELNPVDCTRMYRVIAIIGRWSMLDIFMISILVTLVSLGFISTISPGPGATAFVTTVVLTILSANSFDPRLIWDRKVNSHE